MGLFDRFFGKRDSGDLALEAAVCADCIRIFARVNKQRSGESVFGFAACSVEDACPPYYMCDTLEAHNDGDEKVRPEDIVRYSLLGSPPDWVYQDPCQGLVSEPIIGGILRARMSFEARAAKVFREIVNGLKKFDASGAFKGKLPREDMTLLLWIHDTSNPEWVLQWAKELNPPRSFERFKACFT